ncbi:MAG: 3'-5' exonuclease, partial [Methanothrix sp.]|nr:3'-5' exonuclease [Methanothrix sp.]
MIFQILDANYTYDSSREPLVQLFGSTPEGGSVVCRVAGFRPYFYAGLRESAVKDASERIREMGLDVEVVERFEPIGFQESRKRMLKITTRDPKEVRTLRERIKEIPGVLAVYETDILFKNRFLIDTGLGGMSWVDAPVPDWISTASEGDAPIIRAESLRPVPHEANAPLRFMSLDIECLPDHGEMPRAEVSPIILISMAFEPEYHGRTDLVLVGKRIDCQRDDVLSCQDERDLLSRFVSILRDYNPDIVAGYNSNEFDFP